MSADTSAEETPQKKSPFSVFTSSRSKSQRVNSTIPSELKRNESAARVKRVRQVSDKKDNVAEEISHNADDEDDPCRKKEIKPPVVVQRLRRTPGLDPRFQQTNQTLRCFVMYTDFFRCEKILGEGHEACTWFRDVYKSICPNGWIEKWDEWRAEGRMPWARWKEQGDFPGDRYGV